MRHGIDVTGIIKAALDRDSRLLGCARDHVFSCHSWWINWITAFSPESNNSYALCNRYDLPIVEFNMVRRQGATREHVLLDL